MKEKKKSQKKSLTLTYVCSRSAVSLPPSWFVVQQKRGIEISVEALRMEQHPIK